MLGSGKLGPNEVKGAMAGDGLAPKIVFPGIRVATGFLLVKMYFRIASVPEGLKMFVAGIRKLSTGISLPIFPTMTAAPPALCTSNVWDKPPARQNTTFPFTFSGETLPTTAMFLFIACNAPSETPSCVKRVRGAPPVATPLAKPPSADALETFRPPTVDAV
nr:hypothetical protein Iba_chr06bCG17470 [Ipomoea batatas]